MIELRDVSFGYGPSRVLEGVTARLGPGLTLLVGPNGCGKSSLLKVLAGVERPSAGQALVEGHDLWQNEVAARRALAYVPEHPDLSPYASVVEVLRLVCRLRGEPTSRAAAALEEAGLGTRLHATVRELSAGQRRRALLAAAWVGTPRVVLLDEPLEALDLGLRDRVLAWVGERVRAGALVVVVSHQLEPFLPLASAVASVRGGGLVGPQVLAAEEAARRALVERLARGE